MTPVHTPLFAHHNRLWSSHRYVYPVISRRSRGLSIGINLNPDKRCNFDCVYCSVDRREPGFEGVDLEVIGRELDALLEQAVSGRLFAQPPFDATPEPLRRLNDVAFSGDGEPTSSPHFGAACRLAAEALDRHGARDAKIVVITNGTLLDRPAVREALAFLDGRPSEIWAKLDAGGEERHRRVNRSAVSLAKILENLRVAGQSRPLVLQSMFLALDGVPPSEAELQEYLDAVRDLLAGGCRIARVQVYTVARRTAEAMAAPLPREALDEIAARIRALGVDADVFA